MMNTTGEKRSVLFGFANDKLVSMTVNGRQRVDRLPESTEPTGY